MFTQYCTNCDKVQLIFPSQCTGVGESEGRAVVHFTCWCGAAQTWPIVGAVEMAA